MLLLPAQGGRWKLAADDGGSGGTSNSSIWAATWWQGSPAGPGPYLPPPGGGVDVCAWTDVGATVTGLDQALSTAGLAMSFWQAPLGGGHEQIWGINAWADRLAVATKGADHFDVVACPARGMVPPTGGDVESDLPVATPPGRPPAYVWIFFDTVPVPPPGVLPPLVGRAFDEDHVPSPVLGSSPSSVDEIPDATVVNLPTWLYVAPEIWSDAVARASGGGLTATVWATPERVTWRAYWDLPSPADDPEGGVTLAPERLDLSCLGPGSPYDPSLGFSSQQPVCGFTFTQSSFGLDETLSATLTWSVDWALSDLAGVVGAEGSLGTITTEGHRPLRVVQIESIVTVP